MQIFNWNKTRLFEKINAQTRSKTVRKEIMNRTRNFTKTDYDTPKKQGALQRAMSHCLDLKDVSTSYSFEVFLSDFL